jgi:hypothetical protein
MPPEMPRDFGRYLEDDELVRPGGEAALAVELPQLGRDGHQGVRCCLVGQVIKLGTGDPQLPATSLQLSARYPQQHLVQARQGSLPWVIAEVRPGRPADADGLDGRTGRP